MNGAVPKLPVEKATVLNPVSKNILRILLYFDIFKHPLRKEEIFHCSCEPLVTLSMVEAELNFLLSQNILVLSKGFYLLENNQHHVLRRLSGEAAAQKALKTAYRFSKFISLFPFVRGVCISGSLSKGYMDRETDIDYFIITATGRLWLSRSLLVLFKKIFLLNSRKYFCVNYFVDEENLRIPDKNFFTATELAFIVPTYNYELYARLIDRNNWMKKYYPLFPMREKKGVLPVKKPMLKRFLELLFKGAVGEKLDSLFFSLTLNHWKKKFSYFDESTFDHRFRSRKNVSKHHPKGFQDKILTAWEDKLDTFEIQYGIELR